MRELTGKRVLGIFTLGFGTIIAVNLTLAWNAVATFPGLEVKNSYVASQSFQKDRAAQSALNWDVAATLMDDTLVLTISQDGQPVAPVIESAIFGRATATADDQTPEFTFDGSAFSAPISAGPGNWNLRLEARAADGTLFKQRIIVRSQP